ncbi:40-residue YVTN family beta-propeller repeat-containing protein [Geodermatophilus dictyosporus]|uniref:non-specific serine/threonine protein kinase n=1 Tax=Geodermatophilus dictyosporus TaxID=1523247 RepID=A0A1I5KUH6_9ACTN|nr:serine/threonine-protein kinase [Geodermatophilus dictyosporus]SFO88684.1 40-residue YVTN family beta-propeller repeat-containing protein [Geodermatophilus dictyosporus]
MSPREFGPYLLEELLGTGGMGEVWRARDTRRERLVALKLLPEALNRDAEFAGRFRRESHVAARLREPHVVPIHDYGEIDGRLFIDMRLVDGRDLGRLLEEGPLPPERTVALLAQVADALEAAHADGLVHRDVKPSNVLVTPSDFVYVVDFGIARSIGSTRTSLTITGATVGTLDYMAPERFTDQPIDGRVDVYSLACVLAQCLTGRRPFRGEDLPALLYAHLYVDPPRPSELVAGVPEAMDEVIAQGMAKRPEDRFPTPRALVDAARAALQAAPAAAPAAGAAPPPDPAVPPRTTAPVPSAPPTVLGVRSGDGAHSSVQQLPGPPLPPPPLRGQTPATRPRRRGRRVALVTALVLVLVAAGVAALLWPRDDGGADAAGSPGGTAESTPESTPESTLAPEGATPPPRPTGPPPASLAVPTQLGEPIPVRPTPGYLAVAPNGRYAYIAHRAEGVVSVFDTTSLQVSSTIPIDAAPPQYVAFSPDGSRAYVTAFNADYTVNVVVFVDTTTNEVLQTVDVGTRPYVPETSPDGRLLYVPLHDEARVQVLDTATGAEVASYTVPRNPHWITVSEDGTRAWTANHESGVLSLLDLTADGRVLAEIPAGAAPHSVAISPDGSRVAVVAFDSSTVHLVDVASLAPVEGPVGQRPQDVTWAPDGARFYTADVEGDTMSVVDAETLAVTAQPTTGDGPTSIGVSPDGRRGYVTNLYSATVVVYDLAA